ncbi:hypothetical protein KSP39_PZI010880 [Platanthera zijinensis]|uniref:Transposase n=1 Tax=Platanthera zijinensis TaxID=2320716 RepID=A0AAP0G5M4_9ASPA
MEWSNTFKSMKDIEAKTVIDMALMPHIEALDFAPSSSEKGNTSPVPRPKKKSMTSLYLKFFETAPDGKSRRCKLCKQSYSIATATGNLGRHLNHRHPGYHKLSDLSQQTPEDLLSPNKKPQSQAKTAALDFDHLNWLLLKWHIKSPFPSAAFDDDGFLNSLKFLNSSVTLWSSEKIQSVTLEIFRSMQEDVKTSLQHLSSMVSITLNFWTNHEELHFMSVYCHWVDENWSPHKVILDVRHIPYPSAGSEIFHALLDVLGMFNLEKKVISCTCDNSQHAVNACQALKEELEARKVPFCYIPCAAHALSQIIEDGLKSPKPILLKIREFALELNLVPGIAQDFKQLTAVYQEGVWQFPLDASATWNGLYTMLDLAQKASKSMDSTIKKHEESFRGRNLSLSAAEKSIVSVLHSYLEPFHKITSNLSACKSPTVGLALFFMDHVFELTGACSSDDACRHDWLKSIADDMDKRARPFTSHAYNISTYIAAVLDPRIKKELLPEKLNSDKYLEEARSLFARHYASHGFGSQDPDEANNAVSFAEEIARKRRRVSTSTAADELTQYIFEPPTPIATDVLEWWKMNGSRYPRLSAMARDYLAVQGASVDPEELFSSNGDELRRQQFCLSYGNMRAIMCINSWTHHTRFQLNFNKSAEVSSDKLAATSQLLGRTKSGLVV